MINYSYKNSKYLHKINSLRGGNQALLQEIKKSIDDINQRYANEKEKFKFGSDGLVILNDFVLALCVLSTKFPDFNLDKFIKKGSLLFKVYSVLKDQL